eukprot:scaffold7204_cov354-Prasinococcus_capsulatus_cf.AAC.12
MLILISHASTSKSKVRAGGASHAARARCEGRVRSGWRIKRLVGPSGAGTHRSAWPRPALPSGPEGDDDAARAVQGASAGAGYRRGGARRASRRPGRGRSRGRRLLPRRPLGPRDAADDRQLRRRGQDHRGRGQDALRAVDRLPGVRLMTQTRCGAE